MQDEQQNMTYYTAPSFFNTHVAKMQKQSVKN